MTCGGMVWRRENAIEGRRSRAKRKKEKSKMGLTVVHLIRSNTTIGVLD